MEEQLLYLREVLGVESWIRPQGSQAQAFAGPKAVVLTKASWTPDAKAMVDKILTAVHMDHLPKATELTTAQHVLIFDSQETPGRSENGHQIIWNMGPLRRLISGSAGEIQQAKRDVWNLLKRFKDEANS